MIGAARCSLIGAGGVDPDAARYLYAVEVADTQPLEAGVRAAINTFVRGCKADGIWSGIKASCLLAGARTLSGALVPLVGPTPTSILFQDSDYHRENGLTGNGSSKYINTNASATLAPKNNGHFALWMTSLGTSSNTLIGMMSSSSPLVTSQIGKVSSLTAIAAFSQGGNSSGNVSTTAPTLVGVSRSSSSQFVVRANSSSATANGTSADEADRPYYAFCRNSVGTPSSFVNARLSFYSIGQAIDLEKLDTRLTALMTAISEAI